MAGACTESTVEHAALSWLESTAWSVRNGAAIAPGEPTAERDDYGKVVLAQRLRDALARLNPALPACFPRIGLINGRQPVDLLIEPYRDHRNGQGILLTSSRHQFWHSAEVIFCIQPHHGSILRACHASLPLSLATSRPGCARRLPTRRPSSFTGRVKVARLRWPAWSENHAATGTSRSTMTTRGVLPRATPSDSSPISPRKSFSRQTINDYVTALECVFLLERLPAWHTNRMSRLVKRSKLHMGDTGVACALLGVNAKTLLADRNTLGPMLETFVLQELRRQASWRPERLNFFHFRDRDDFEVDIVIERGQGAVAGVEVKAGASVTESDLRGLRKLRDTAGTRFAAGVILYDGAATIRFERNLFAVPVRMLWETT